MIERNAMHTWRYLFREAYQLEDQAFIDAIMNNTEPRVSGYDGLMAIKVVRCGLKSLLEKRIVDLEKD